MIFFPKHKTVHRHTRLTLYSIYNLEIRVLDIHRDNQSLLSLMEPNSLSRGEVRTDCVYSHCASRVELTDTTALVRSKSQISTRRSRVELREHHSISHQVIKVVVFQLPTPTGLALMHAQCLRSVYVANRCSGISLQGSRSSR
ncbi:UNVERIFIED_CONTAM: hypothetical protein NCL1_49084 [Trichonephila clavipes]